MVVLQQPIAHSFLDGLLALQIVDGTPLQTSTCTVVDCVPIVYQEDMQVAFPNRIVVIGMVEVLVIGSLEDSNGVVSDHNATSMGSMLVGMVPLQGIGLVTSMHYRGVLPSCTTVDHMADLPFRTEVVLVMLFVGETMALLVGRIEAGTKMQKLATFVLVRTIVD